MCRSAGGAGLGWEGERRRWRCLRRCSSMRHHLACRTWPVPCRAAENSHAGRRREKGAVGGHVQGAEGVEQESKILRLELMVAAPSHPVHGITHARILALCPNPVPQPCAPVLLLDAEINCAPAPGCFAVGREQGLKRQLRKLGGREEAMAGCASSATLPRCLPRAACRATLEEASSHGASDAWGLCMQFP